LNNKRKLRDFKNLGVFLQETLFWRSAFEPPIGYDPMT